MKWLSISMKNTVERKNPSLSSVLTVENVLPEKYTLEHHQQHYHQVGGAINNDKKDTKRKLKHDSGKEAKKTKLPAKVDGFFTADKEVSTMKGAKVNAFFSRKQKVKKQINKFFSKKPSRDLNNA